MPNAFDIGRMRDLLTWQTNNPVRNFANQMVPVWTSQGTHYAEVIFDPGDEATNANQLKAGARGKIKMWASVGPVKASDRFLYNDTGRIFGVVSVRREDNVNAYLLIEFKELMNPQ